MPLIRALLHPARLAVRGLRRLRLAAAAAEHDLGALWGRRYRASARPLCLVSHDAHRHGAQLLALELARLLGRVFGLELHIVLLGPGPLKVQFRRYGAVHELTAQEGPQAEALAAALAARGVQHALVNSTASGLFLGALTRAGVRCVALVHELPGIIAERGLTRHADAIRVHARLTVFPTDAVRERFPGGAPDASLVRAQGLARRRGAATPAQRSAARKLLQRRHGIPEDALIVLNVGYGDTRKGIDLFLGVDRKSVV